MIDTNATPDALAPLAAQSAAWSALVARAAPLAVAVQARRRRLAGIALSPELIVTADEALPGRGDLRVETARGEAPATILGRDPSTDVALLRVERPGGAGTAAGEESRPAGAGDAATGGLVAVVGRRDGAPLAAYGAVSHVGPAWRSLRGGEVGPRVEIDVVLPDALEGAPVMDASGSLLGMAVPAPRGRTLVIPTATLGRVADALRERGNIPRGHLGLSLRPVRLEAERDGSALGLKVVEVEAGGPGARGGVRRGDVVLGWDGARIAGLRDLAGALGPDAAGRTVAMDVLREGERTHLEVTVGERAQV